MVLETRSPEETYNVGKKLGEHAIPGQVFTLTGDLGVGKTVFTQGLAIALHLRSYRYMRKGDFLSIILTCTGSVMWRRWKKSGSKTTSWEMAFL